MFVVELPSQNWSVGSCVSMNQRDELARFWLAAPDDLLPSLWSSPLGDATRALVRQLTPETSFTSEQVSFRDAIGVRLQAGFQAPSAIQLLLATWLYSPPGLMKIVNPEDAIPDWLLPAYKELFETSEDSSPANQSTKLQPATQLPEPNIGEFPSTLEELVNNRVQLNRMLGLSNLYYIDPEDDEIREELKQVRIALAKAIQVCPENQLERLWSTDLGDRFWALVRSGIQKETLEQSEEALKQTATQHLSPAQGGGFGSPGALNAFLVAMLFYEPGTMRVDEAEQKLPSWLLSPYQKVFAEALQPGG